MTLKKFLTTGTLTLIALFIFGGKPTHADFCGPGNATHYKKVYCQIQLNDNGDANSEITAIIAKQFELQEKTVEQILDGTICSAVAKMNKLEKIALPKRVSVACSSEKAPAENIFLAQNLFLDVQNSFQKEKALFFNQMSLKMKFKASEQYWDGKVGFNDAPFDLMTDLNLIDKVLFGSKAQWNGDVYNFPKKENEKDEPQVPLDELLKQNNNPKIPKQDLIDPPNEAPADCVPVGDPEADPNAKPMNPLCGNGNLDLLSGEQCDDNNKNSGDGCNQYCQTETGGASKMCVDPEALTFKQAPTLSGEDENACPQGSVPKKEQLPFSGNLAQTDGYPGPFIGGTLKQFPASERPPCGPGKTTVEITVAGKKQIAKDVNGDPVCLSTAYCGDPDKVRTFLAASSFPFPEGSITASQWKLLPEKNPIRQALEAIEVTACVNVIKENRPTSFYNPNEGCVDCHLRAMVDALEETLSTNVTPLANSTKAFGLSSRFGPNMSFNLQTLVKPKLKFKESDTGAKAVEQTKDDLQKMVDDALKPTPSLPNPGTDFNLLNDNVRLEQSISQEIKDGLKGYNRSGGSIAEIELISRVTPLIGQMRMSFESMQAQYQGMVKGTALNETPTICK